MYFCVARSYENTSQLDDVKLFILSTMSMISQYTKDESYINLTVQFFDNTKCYDNPTFKKECPDTNSLFDWMVRYYNHMRANMNYKLRSKEELDSEYDVDKMTKTWWGRKTWMLIHVFAAYAPIDCTYSYFVSYRAFIVTLSKLLPCHDCRGHLQKNMKTLPMDCYAGGRLALFSWSHKLHNVVNKQTGAPDYKWDKAVKDYGVVVPSS
jgi:hypothetical protein